VMAAGGLGLVAAGDERLLTQSNRIEVGLCAETDADAAAGGCRSTGNVESDSDQSVSGGRGATAVCLPAQPRGSSTVASAGLAQLERSLSDVSTLQSQAMAAIDRIAKQQAALRRFPMACPSCGTLNAPCGLAWGAGDIVACQGCSQSFVPLGHGLQDSDLSVLRAAVGQLRGYSERIQYLEQVLSTSRTPNAHAALGPLGLLSPSAADGLPPWISGGSPRRLYRARLAGDKAWVKRGALLERLLTRRRCLGAPRQGCSEACHPQRSCRCHSWRCPRAARQGLKTPLQRRPLQRRGLGHLQRPPRTVASSSWPSATHRTW